MSGWSRNCMERSIYVNNDRHAELLPGVNLCSTVSHDYWHWSRSHFFPRDADVPGKPHQFGERPHLHFFHHSRSVHFDGFFHGAELGSNQFVRHPARHQSHHFALTRSQLFDAPLNVFNFYPHGTITARTSE